MKKPRALAISTTGLGDLIMGIPALDALGCSFKLDVIAHRRRLDVLIGHPAISLLYPYRANLFYRLGLGMRQGKEPYQRVVLLHGNQDVRKLLRWLSYEQAANMQAWQNPKLHLEAVETGHLEHVIDKRLALAAWAGAPIEDAVMRVYLGREELNGGEAWLQERKVTMDRPRVALCPGAADAYKRWPAQRFGELAKLVQQAGAAVVVLGSKDELPLYQAIAAACEDQEPLCAMGLGLRPMASILARCDLLVSNDTGPLHLAEALEVPVLGLFGPTDPKATGPRRPRSRVIKAPADCEPCLTKKCADPHCMEAIELAQVLEVLSRIMAQGPGPRVRV